MLIEEECQINEEKMANTVLKLAVMSKEADTIVKVCRFWESQVMNNEVKILSSSGPGPGPGPIINSELKKGPELTL